MAEANSVDEKVLEGVKKDFQLVKVALLKKCPFVSSLLFRCRVVLAPVGTACVGCGTMYIDPDYWSSLDYRDKAFLVAHEVFHIAFMDLDRVGSRNKVVWNLVTDVINNYIIASDLITPNYNSGFLMPTHVSNLVGRGADEIEKMSKEELYELMKDKVVEVKLPDLMGVGGGGAGGEGNGEFYEYEVQAGDPFLTDRRKSFDERSELWKDAVATAYAAQKEAGSTPARLKRFVDEFLKSEIDWRSLLRRRIIEGVGRSLMATWKRPSRKHGDWTVPGYKKVAFPSVWCLIDTSGSISKEELKRFVSEVYGAASLARCRVLFWDAAAYDVVHVDKKYDVAKAIDACRGGGGTCVAPALKKCLEGMKHGDVVVVFSDGYIFDMEQGETKELAARVKSRSSVALFCSTQKDDFFGWESVKVKF